LNQKVEKSRQKQFVAQIGKSLKCSNGKTKTEFGAIAPRLP
jgi:hypothetical protein